MELNLNYEKRLLDLLGYTLSNHDKSKCYKIFSQDEEVGNIEYKKIKNKNVKKGEPAIYGLVTNIDSKEIIFKNVRKVYDNGFQTYSNQDMDTYTFEIKRDKDIDYIELTIGESFNINLWSKQYGYSKLSIDYEGIVLFFNSRTDNFNIKEFISYQINQIGLIHYTYQISYCDKSLRLTGDKGVTTREISGYQVNNNTIKILERSYFNNRIRTNKEYDVIGKVDEMVTLHQMGIDAFNHYRYLLNKILPFKCDIIDEVITDEMIDEYNLELFIPKKENKTFIKENSNEKR